MCALQSVKLTQVWLWKQQISCFVLQYRSLPAFKQNISKLISFTMQEPARLSTGYWSVDFLYNAGTCQSLNRILVSWFPLQCRNLPVFYRILVSWFPLQYRSLLAFIHNISQLISFTIQKRACQPVYRILVSWFPLH